MKDKIINWFVNNWKPIGYTIGTVNIISGLGDMMTGSFWFGLFWIALGSFIIYDVRTNG
jgi:hypothetical protein